MATLKEEAQAYEPPQTYNIALLDRVPVDIDIKDGVGKNKEGEEFSYKFVEIDGRQYRIPGSVLGGIKALIQKMPTVKHVSVMKYGEGMNTRYQVVPVIDQQVTEEKVLP